MVNPPGSAKNNTLYAYHLVLAVLSSMFILILAFVGIKNKVYRNYPSMLMIAVMVFEGIDVLIISILHLNDFFNTIERDFIG